MSTTQNITRVNDISYWTDIISCVTIEECKSGQSCWPIISIFASSIIIINNKVYNSLISGGISVISGHFIIRYLIKCRNHSAITETVVLRWDVASRARELHLETNLRLVLVCQPGVPSDGTGRGIRASKVPIKPTVSLKAVINQDSLDGCCCC